MATVKAGQVARTIWCSAIDTMCRLLDCERTNVKAWCGVAGAYESDIGTRCSRVIRRNGNKWKRAFVCVMSSWARAIRVARRMYARDMEDTLVGSSPRCLIVGPGGKLNELRKIIILEHAC